MAQQETVTDTEKSETVDSTSDSTTEVQTDTEQTEAEKVPAEATEEKSYTKEEFEAAVKKGIADGVKGTIESRVARASEKTKAAEQALAAQTAELEELRATVASSGNELVAVKQNALLFELAYKSKLPLVDLEPLKELPEAAFRASVAAIIKHSPAADETSFSDLFDGKDYTQPPAPKDFAAGIFKKKG
jgi:hypothetical protein